jgi:class 3 adenylate cyclase/tRNA A-37 threonylcarbamoyl transferase component Bud32
VTDGTSGRRTVKKTSRRRSNIPTGTVTFLFTDIEGSTAMWEDHPDQMQNALTRHDEILHAAVEARGGYVFKMIGDACCAAFASDKEATLATLEAQRALFAEPWDEHTTIRVRMALHTGVAEERGGDYFGPPVNRVARLLSAGHGGQILLSAVTYGLARDTLRHLEPSSELRDLGEYRLRDLRYTERIYQLVVPDLPTDFPPPKGELITAGTPPDGQHIPGPQETPAVAGLPPQAAGPEQREEVHGVAPPREERYARKRTIGSGGMAEVYLAHDEVLDRDVALKVLRRQYAEDERFVERFKREARNAASLSHPNIVAVHDRGETADGAYYIVMEYMAGGTLKDRIEKEGPLPPPVATQLALQIARALEVAHRRDVIHRDIKPQNVLLDESGEAKVGDFGIARAASSSTMTKTGSVMGTAHYISPEQALGQPATPQSDLYSLGVVLYEMLTGKLPHDAETPVGIAMQHVSGQLRPPREVNPDVPEGINAIVVRLLAKDPGERYQSAAELVEDLERVQRAEAPVLGAAPHQAVAPVSTPPARPPADPASGDRPRPMRPEAPSEAPTVPQPVRPGGPGGARWPLRGVLVAAGLLGALVVVGLGVAAWLLVSSPQGENQALTVPSLEGKELAAARQQVNGNFELVSGQERSSDEPKGTILEQTPEPGAEVPEGEEISVVVSSGTENVAELEEEVRTAAEDYYEAVDMEDWSYTYNNLDSRTRRMFTEEEWRLKNQWFADNESLEVNSLNVGVDLSSSETVADVTVDRTFKDGTSIVRDTYFVYEEGSWKHRFGEEEIDIFMPEASYEEFVAAQGGASAAASPPDEPAGPAPGYDLIEDPTGGLTVEAPPSWEIDTGQESEYPPGVAGARNWSTFAGEEITSSITTAPSLDTWYSEPATGAYLVASRTLAQNYSDDDLIFYGLFSGLATNCEQGPYEDFDRSSLSGKMQTWNNCLGEGVTNYVVAAAPEGRECVVVLQARFVDEADREAIQHMIDTVAVNCGEIAGIDAEDPAVEFASSSADTPASS